MKGNAPHGSNFADILFAIAVFCPKRMNENDLGEPSLIFPRVLWYVGFFRKKTAPDFPPVFPFVSVAPASAGPSPSCSAWGS